MSRHDGYRRADVDQKLAQIRDELKPMRGFLGHGRYEVVVQLPGEEHKRHISGERDWEKLRDRLVKPSVRSLT